MSNFLITAIFIFLVRFLHMVGSPDILNIAEDFENEISQLDKTRRFQLSIDIKVVSLSVYFHF